MRKGSLHRAALAATSIALLLFAIAPRGVAGPIIIDGTDSNDHGFASGGANQDGWKYMQRVLENLAGSSSLSPSAAKVVVNLGADIGTQAGLAIASAFNLSSLPGAGWTLQTINGGAAVSTYLDTIGIANTGILAIPTYNNSSGDLDSSEMAAVNAHATQINNFVTANGGLFAMGESNSGAATGAWGWLTTLVPGLVPVDDGTGGIGNPIVLTAAGTASFPGLTNADLSSGPWHGHFTGSLGGLTVLGTSTLTGSPPDVNLILGANISGGGIVINPAVPEPTSVVLLGLGCVAVAGLATFRRRRAA
jgi:hypothetical protein